MPQIINIDLPDYKVDSPPDEIAVGDVVDRVIKKHYMGRAIVVRGIASSEHPNKSIDELIDIIKETGTDKYDSTRIGDRYENIDGKHIDLFAVPETITASSEVFKVLVWGFYHSAIAVHGYPVRIDVVMIYDADKMEKVLHQYEGRDEIKEDGFAFKDPANKADALMGIIKIS